MLQAALRSGAAQRRCVFEVFARRLPDGPPVRRRGRHRPPARGRSSAFRFGADELDRAARARRGRRADAGLPGRLPVHRRRSGATPRASATSPGRPSRGRGHLRRGACCWRRWSCSILNHDSAVAAAASPDDHRRRRPALHRDGLAPHPRAGRGRRRPRGLRRRVRDHQQPRGGADATACRPPAPRAHAFTLLHDDERAAFAAQVACLGKGTTLLVDTYDVPTAVDGRGRGRRARARRRAARLRRPAHPGREVRRAARRPGRHRDPDHRDVATWTSTPSRRSPPPRSTRYGVGTSPGHRLRRARPPGWSTSWSPARTTSGAPGGRGQEEQGQGQRRRPEVGAAPARRRAASPRPR